MENENNQTPESMEIIEEIIIEAPVEENPIEAQAPRFSWKKLLTRKNIIIAIIVVAVLLVMAGVYYGKSLFVAASVNGEAVSRLEVIRNSEKAYGKAILDDAIRKVVFNQELLKNNISVSEEDIQGEMNKLEESLKKQGQTLEGALEEQKLSRVELRERIVLRKGIEKLLGDKIAVSDQEIEQYIKDSGTTLTKGKEEEEKNTIREGLKANKFNDEAQKLAEELLAKAKIDYFVKY